VNRSPQKNKVNKLPFPLLIGLVLFFILASFWAGRFSSSKSEMCKESENSIQTLRLANNNEFTSPLLACDPEAELNSTQMDSLSKNIEQYIQSEINLGQINTASVYVRNYGNNNSLTVNPDEKYFPASLNKIPFMIAAFKTAKIKPNFFSETHTFNDSRNFNTDTEVPPEDSLESGHTYSISEAIDKMIKDSDNNALSFIGKYLEPDLYKKTFEDLKIPLTEDPATISDDYMSVKEFSYFLRVLYNSTYLGQDLSEKALKILSEAKFKDGLVAGLPKDTKIAHKFGIQTKRDKGTTTRELHDCGIVYKDKPYLICVMTKSNASLEQNEKVIQNISSLVYQAQ
jgi:beta-lactamase class A